VVVHAFEDGLPVYGRPEVVMEYVPGAFDCEELVFFSEDFVGCVLLASALPHAAGLFDEGLCMVANEEGPRVVLVGYGAEGSEGALPISQLLLDLFDDIQTIFSSSALHSSFLLILFHTFLAQ
jgi:hypothetical protein